MLDEVSISISNPRYSENPNQECGIIPIHDKLLTEIMNPLIAALLLKKFHQELLFRYRSGYSPSAEGHGGGRRPYDDGANRPTECEVRFKVSNLTAEVGQPSPRPTKRDTGDSAPPGSTSSINGSVLLRPSKNATRTF